MLASLRPNRKHMSSNPAHRPLRPVRSFRVERSTSPEPTTRPKRASTFENGPSSALRPSLRTTSGTQVGAHEPDTFQSRISEEIEPPRASVDLDDLPIELISFTDRFIDGLSAKVHPTPPTVDSLSRMFQDFYATASSHIQTHVDTLATRQRREEPPRPPPLSTRASAASLLRAKAASLGTKEKAKLVLPRKDSDQQLLTAEELEDRKKARRALQVKKSLLEEAVERRLCEGIYGKIYRHRSTQDEAQDAKLRSKTAALSVVGIGLTDLGVDLGTDNDSEAAAKKQEEVKEWLEQARKELVLMTQSRYPLGKLNHLKSAHKSIIDTLSHFHPSSSADELMPMLIYTLITLPPENLNAISDVNFIQRFRWEPKLSGEAAYCLTTLEATISFLETVDLSTLRADETPTGPAKQPGALSSSVPKTEFETFPAFPHLPARQPQPPTQNPPPPASPRPSSPPPNLPTSAPPSPPQQPPQRRGSRRLSELSDLVKNTPAQQALTTASDTLLTTADQSSKHYKFLLGKLRERSQPPLDTLLSSKDGSTTSSAFPDLAGVLPPREYPKINPPVKRFMEAQNAADLRLGEVFDLLKEYKRLAGALKEMGAFKE
ncbi:hypothetical protein N0V88_005870 [Collariella sp. IMI 366227]|nr:hypothetical protein N0V88_005870 [Collariella sp. IMI 366227]